MPMKAHNMNKFRILKLFNSFALKQRVQLYPAQTNNAKLANHITINGKIYRLNGNLPANAPIEQKMRKNADS